MILLGRLTAEPELKQTPSGVFLTNFQLAVDCRFKDKAGERKADFINIVAWRQSAEFVCRYFGKGDPVGVEGSIQTRNYEDKQGNRRTAFEVVAERVFFVGGKRPGKDGGNASGGQASGSGDFEEVEDGRDLPF